MKLKFIQKKGNYLLFLILLVCIIFISGCVSQNAGENVTNQSRLETAVHSTQGLQIVLKDPGMPEVKYLQPTIKEVQLQNEAEKWITIWSNSEGKALKLTPDGTEYVLDTVSVEAGTYVGTRLWVSTIDVEVDINRDGDTLDKNQEICLTEEEFNNLPPKLKPSAETTALIKPEEPSRLPEPTAPSKPVEDKPHGEEPGEESPEPEEPSRPTAPSEPEEPSRPPEPIAPSEPEAPYTYKIINGVGYFCTEVLDEQHSVTVNDYMVPLGEEMWVTNFVYDGNGGKIIYDFTLSPFEYKGQQILVEVSTTT